MDSDSHRRRGSGGSSSLYLATAMATSVLAVLAGLPGCSYPVRGNILERLEAELGLTELDEAYGTPDMRFGTMPFDAWYSPLIALGPDDLGRHAYVAPDEVKDGTDRGDEVSRGTLYTTRAGFLDIAHLRNAIDMTRFTYVNVRAVLRHGNDHLEILSAEPDVYNVTFHLPPEWRELGPGQISPEQERDIHEASIQIAGRLAYLMTTWHEVLTFFGYKALGIIPEEPSAFSYDDAASHRVGIEVAMRALRQERTPDHFDHHVTAELRDHLIELGAVGAAEMKRRAEAAEGRFWRGSKPYLRVVDLGMDGHPLPAYLLDDDIEPVVWDWPEDAEVAGHRINDLYEVTIRPKTFEARAIRRAVARPEGPLDPRRDFRHLHAYIDARLEARDSTDAAEPLPAELSYDTAD